jgi:ubiquinone/menaquinone biosynthesis C-methylase UbiE
LQLRYLVNPNLLFKNYLYVSGTSKVLVKHFENYFLTIQKKIKLNKSHDKILDIACNDGTQLHKFKLKGWKTFGIDPAENLYEYSSKIADKIVVSYFNKDSIKSINEVSFDAITAQNVFAHTDDVDMFLQDCKTIMDDHTKLFIQTSQADMIEEGQFDTIYHEHLSFFSTKSMKILCERNGLYLNSVKRVDIHGGSYIFTISKVNASDSTVIDSLNKEQKLGRYSLEKYQEYSSHINNIINTSKQTIQKYIEQGYIIVGYGAAAKGNTFLNASNIKPHFIIDDNALKHNKLTPGSNCIIVDKQFIKLLSHNVLFVPLSWNFYDEIKNKIVESLNENKFSNLFSYEILRYYPEFKLEKIK